MGIRSTSRKAHFLLRLLALNKNSGREADLARAVWRIVSAVRGLLPPKCYWFPGTLKKAMGPLIQPQRESVQVSRIPVWCRDGWGKGVPEWSLSAALIFSFVSVNYLILKLRKGRTQFANKRLDTHLQHSLYLTKNYLLSSVGLAVFLARKITKIWDFFCLTLCFQMTEGPEISQVLKAMLSLRLLCYLNRIWNACDIKSCKSYLKAVWQKICSA